MAELLMDHQQTRTWLDAEWKRVLNEASSEPDPEADALVDSKVGSIRYAVVTQILGKIADPGRSLLALQLGATGEGAWDARSFATAVIVPWERDNQQVIGKSPDPYVSKPLRRPRLDDDTSVRDRGEWASLVAFLQELDGLPAGELQHAFRRVLRALERRQARQAFAYPVPSRISQARLETLVAGFLEQPSGGLRPMVVATALFRTLGEGFGLFAVVRSQGVNEADSASGVPGDIVCWDRDGNIRLVVEVKDTKLTLAHLQEARLKSKQSDDLVSNFLFAAPGIRQEDAGGVAGLTRRSWAEGLNIYTVSIAALLGGTLVLLDESWRGRLVREIGRELDARQNQIARRAWFERLGQDEE